VKKIINTLISKLFIQDLPTKDNAFIIQKQLLKRLLSSYKDNPLYRNIWLKQDETFDVLHWSETKLKEYISQFPLIEYIDHILPLYKAKSGIVSDHYDLLIRTSGTSDANNWGKLIPANWSSFHNENIGIKRTLSYYLKVNPVSSLFFTSSFSLTAPFNKISKIGYVSGAIRFINTFYKYMLFPSDDILDVDCWKQKKNMIVNQLLEKEVIVWSFHGVPTRWLDIINELIEKDSEIAKEVLKKCEYISIGWWPALDYKQQFQDILRSLWLSQKVYGSNNHNASEWFLWSQVRYFDDLEYHWMSPVMQTNFFLFVPVNLFDEYKNTLISYEDMIMQSFLLHEVEFEREYMMLFANDRIPWLYNIKDKVIFKNNAREWWDILLEYLVIWRYGMASNLFNEHIELPHLLYVFDKLVAEWYQLDKNNFVAGMQFVNNNGIFYIIVESSVTETYDAWSLISIVDVYLWEVNDQWKNFRDRKKIIDIKIIIVHKNYIRDNLIELGKMHEQSKLPHLSDYNYINIIEPLLQQIKK
jgi:hypothetical protein